MNSDEPRPCRMMTARMPPSSSPAALEWRLSSSGRFRALPQVQPPRVPLADEIGDFDPVAYRTSVHDSYLAIAEQVKEDWGRRDDSSLPGECEAGSLERRSPNLRFLAL